MKMNHSETQVDSSIIVIMIKMSNLRRNRNKTEEQNQDDDERSCRKSQEDDDGLEDVIIETLRTWRGQEEIRWEKKMKNMRE